MVFVRQPKTAGLRLISRYGYIVHRLSRYETCQISTKSKRLVKFCNFFGSVDME